jgi:hypothetical protein
MLGHAVLLTKLKRYKVDLKRLSMTVVTLTALAGNASAGVFLDFEGVGNGASVNDFYNGGTDSMGNSGTNYGVSFSGGVVRYNQYGAYLAGPTTMTFSAGLAGIGLSLLGDALNDDISSLSTGTLGSESVHIDTTYIPSGAPGNARRFGEGTLFGALASNPFDMYQISFSTRGLDNIMFDSQTRQADRIIEVGSGTIELPEPSIMALLGLGAFGLLMSRRRMHL